MTDNRKDINVGVVIKVTMCKMNKISSKKILKMTGPSIKPSGISLKGSL